jgi:hypothetical protein
VGLELVHYIFSFITTAILGLVGYFLNRIMHELDEAQSEIQRLRERVAILLDRDRQRRLSDYERWNEDDGK